MLDLTILTQRLTQGQAPAELTVLAAPPTQSASESAPNAVQGPSASLASPASTQTEVDPQLIAARVYELMRREVAVWNQRRGR
jgi:hypothetical protein